MPASTPDTPAPDTSAPDTSTFDSWTYRPSAADLAAAFRRALGSGALGGVPAVVFHDLGQLRARVRTLQRLFPEGTLHAVAIKANPLIEVLREVVTLGAGLEAASMEEVHCALAAGCPPGRIVYNSPAKRTEDLADALRLGLLINADTVEELARIDALRASAETAGTVSLRVNPLVGEGTIAITSVAHRSSKFGVPLDRAPAIADAFRRYPWLSGLHLHVGSQGCETAMLAQAARLILELRTRIHETLGRAQVTTVNIGGGLPWAYRADAAPPSPERYAELLRHEAGALFADGLALVTEFGRSVQAGCGWAASRVEYVKDDRAEPMAVIHLGADFLMRTAYHPEDWPHRLSVLTPEGEVKTGEPRPQTVAGPLCFSGDVIARSRPLPPIEPGDWLVIHDAGAYTLGMWSRHCSRGLPLVLGYDERAAADGFKTLRRRETPEDVAAFWSA